MTLYIFTSIGNKISREEIEVVEKPNTYVEASETRKHKHSYHKDALDKLNKNYSSLTMISLSGNPENFIKLVIKERRNQIKELELQQLKIKQSISELFLKYEGVITNRASNDTYHAVGSLNFTKNEDGTVTAEKENVEDIKVPITNIVSGNDLISALESGALANVRHIFVDGRVTNLAIEGYENGKDCVISIEKFKKLHNKAKVEADCD